MQRFLLYVGLLFGLYVSFNLLFTYFVDYPRKDYVKDLPKGDYFLFGDSHAGNIFPDDPAYVNFSYGSDDLLDVQRKVIYACENGLVNPGGTVILEVDLHLFSDYRTTFNNNDLSGYFVRDLRSIFNYHFPLLGDRRILSPDILFSKKRAIQREHVAKIETAADSGAFIARFSQHYSARADFRLNRYYLKRLEETIKIIRSNNIRVLGVIYPLHPYTSHLVKREIRYNDLRDSIATFFKHDEFIDLSDSLTSGGYFRDPDHVNLSGSARFLDIISRHLKRKKTH